MRKVLALLTVVVALSGCGPTRHDLLACRGEFSVAATQYDSALIAGEHNACAWYLGWKLTYGRDM